MSDKTPGETLFDKLMELGFIQGHLPRWGWVEWTHKAELEAAAQAVLDASPVVIAARACVHGYSDRTPDGGGVHVGPFDPDTCRALHDAVEAMEGGEE